MSASVSSLEQELASARARLAGTIDEIAYRAKPEVIAERQMNSLKLKVDQQVRTPDGDLRVERIAAVAAAGLAVIAGIVLLRRRRR